MVLVVDDDPLVLRGTARRVRRLTPCVCATTATASLDLIERYRFDGALVDELLPDGTGLDILARLRAKSRTAVLALVTGARIDASLTDAAALLRARVHAKPIGDNALTSFIEAALSSDPIGMAARAVRLTLKETELVRSDAAGVSRRVFARKTGRTLGTIRTHARSICKKSGFPHVRAFINSIFQKVDP